MIAPVVIAPIARAPGSRTGTRAERLTAYLQEAAGQRFRWGVNDCAIFVADWIAQEADWDLLDSEMKAYGDEEAAQALLAARGGLMQAFADRCRAAGLKPVDTPAPGDVAVINNGRPLCAIRTADYFASAGVRGVILLPAWLPVFCAFALPVEN